MYLVHSTHLCIPDQVYNWLATRAEGRQHHARAPGTRANHRAAVKNYIAFCVRFAIPPTRPTHHHICAYIEYMTYHPAVPGTVKNNLSHKRMYLKMVGRPTKSTYHPRVIRALQAVLRNKARPQKKKPSVPIEVMKMVLARLTSAPYHVLMRALIIVLYYSGLRQSEVVPPTASVFSPTWHLTRADMVVTTHGVRLQIKAAKNMQRYDQQRSVYLPRVSTEQLCPVRAVAAAITMTPTASPAQPLLTFPGGRPMMAAYASKTWKDLTTQAGIQPGLYSLHSIRKTAATTAYNAGCSDLQVKAFGGWSSSAFRDYIYTNSSKHVNKTVINAIS